MRGGGGGGAGGKVNHGVNRLLNKQQSRAFFKGTRSDKCELNSGFPNPGWLARAGSRMTNGFLSWKVGKKSEWKQTVAAAHADFTQGGARRREVTMFEHRRWCGVLQRSAYGSDERRGPQ